MPLLRCGHSGTHPFFAFAYHRQILRSNRVLSMIRSLAFTTQGRLHSRNLEVPFMPTLLGDTNLFLWVDLEQATPEESKRVLEDVFHFHPLSIEDCLLVSPSPKVEEYLPRPEDKFTPSLFMVIHDVDY